MKTVLQMRSTIECKRHQILAVPSILEAEQEAEIESQEDLMRNIKKNIDAETQKQKQKFKEMKEKFDRDGVEFIQN